MSHAAHKSFARRFSGENEKIYVLEFQSDHSIAGPKSGMGGDYVLAPGDYSLVAPRIPQQKQKRFFVLASAVSMLLIAVVTLANVERGPFTMLGDFARDADSHVTGAVTKFLPDEDEIGDNGGVSDYGISNDYLQDTDKEVHNFIQINTDPISGILHPNVPTRDMIAVINGTDTTQRNIPTGLENLPPSAKDDIINEVADDPLMRKLEGQDVGY